jgi:hypothetical protein
MSNVEQRQSIYVNATLTATGLFKFPVDVPVTFVADEMIVRQIAYDHSAADVGVFSIQCGAVDDATIGLFQDPCCFSSCATYKVTKPIQGSIEFKIKQGLAPATTALGQLSIILEFIKYKK